MLLILQLVQELSKWDACCNESLWLVCSLGMPPTMSMKPCMTRRMRLCMVHMPAMASRSRRQLAANPSMLDDPGAFCLCLTEPLMDTSFPAWHPHSIPQLLILQQQQRLQATMLAACLAKRGCMHQTWTNVHLRESARVHLHHGSPFWHPGHAGRRG